MNRREVRRFSCFAQPPDLPDALPVTLCPARSQWNWRGSPSLKHLNHKDTKTQKNNLCLRVLVVKSYFNRFGLLRCDWDVNLLTAHPREKLFVLIHHSFPIIVLLNALLRSIAVSLDQ
jgi:hypothetical protein